MFYFLLVASVLAVQNSGVLELTGDAPKVQFGALTLIHNATEDKLTCSGTLEASDVRITGTSTTVADLITRLAALESQTSAMLRMLPSYSVECDMTVDNEMIAAYFNGHLLGTEATLPTRAAHESVEYLSLVNDTEGYWHYWHHIKTLHFNASSGGTLAIHGRNWGLAVTDYAGLLLGCWSNLPTWAGVISTNTTAWKVLAILPGSSPPAGWESPDFDDQAWMAPILTPSGFHCNSTLSVSGRFGCQSQLGQDPMKIWAPVVIPDGFNESTVPRPHADEVLFRLTVL